jgi:glutamate-ammonia-ligase adenylyltransferase
MTDRFRLPEIWPQPADPAAAERLLERFAELGATEARLARRPEVAAMLRGLGGNAPYLADLALRESATLRLLLRAGPEVAAARAMQRVAATRPTAPRAQIAAIVRGAKRAVALTVAVADIGGLWRLDQVTAALSDLAEQTLCLCTAHLLRAGHDRGELRLPHPGAPNRESGFTVLGMGKLGARELNYSSDIDLILLQDPESGVYHGEAARAFYTRMSRDLVTLMEARDADGYVFRTDLRLRPDPAATPPCISLPTAIAYYESMGQNWERAAMLKARPVAGDIALGHAFLEAIRPFIWRRHLDFAAVADIHAMKRRIDAHKGTALDQGLDPAARIAGHDVKLGEGGIREIEFLAQTLQLVWGGRDPGLRTRRTLEALRLLVKAGHVPARTAAGLARSYRFLRQVEHRLQMVADRQTHSLPERPEQLAAFALFMGFADAAAFADALLRHLGRVQAGYGAWFRDVPGEAEDAGALDFGAIEAPAATLQRLAALGFGNADAIVKAVRAWQSGRIRALRSPRSQELMQQILPRLLAALARQSQPDSAFARFEEFLARLPAGVQLLSLIERNPALLGRIAAILGAGPSLADHLARTPSALEGLLVPDGTPDPARLIRARLGDARALEDAIAIIRATVREEDFSVSVATMEGRLDADAAGAARSALADAALAALLPPVLDDFARRFGRVRRGEMVLVLLGKAGGQEMMAGSDLDMMLIYDHPATVTESTAAAPARPLPASQWFIRAVHAFVAALTAPDAEGKMFSVDMRLRPSGNKGPVAVSLAAFERYHAEEAHGLGAWTWERMALTRARVVAGPPGLRAKVEAAIARALASAGPPARIRADAAAMRARLLRDLPPTGPWDVKLRPGGQIEVEFIAQVLQLAHVGTQPQVLSPTTRLALRRLQAACALPDDDAALLVRADRIWRTVQGMLRITVGQAGAGREPAERLSDASADALLRAASAAGVEAVDVSALRANLDDLAQLVRAAFIRHVGEPSA